MSEMEQADGAVVVAAESGLSLKGLYEVFLSPMSFFERLGKTPKVLVGMLTIIILSGVFVYATQDILAQMQYDMTVQQMEEKGQTVPPVMSVELFKKTVWVSLPFMVLIPVIYAALFMFIGNFVLGTNVSYKQMLAVAVYGEIIFAVGNLFLIPLILSKGMPLVSIGPAAFIADPMNNMVMFTALGKLGVFQIWEIIVAGLGLSAVCQISRNKGLLLSVISIGGLSLVHSVITYFTV